MHRFIFILLLFIFPLTAKLQTADFTFQSSDGLFCNPSTIQFSQKCTGNPTGFVWDFGNNTDGFTGDATATYTNSGTYFVKLIAIYDQTTIEVSKTIVINPAIATTIGFDRNYICTPGVINFNGITSGNTANYSWSFGDSTPTQNSTIKDITHNYSNFGTYQVSLKATDITGCSGIAFATIKVIKPPMVLASATPVTGCIPININFNANISIPVNGSISSFTWDFSDGSPLITTATNNIPHLYSAVGIFSTKLNIVTNEGCTNSYNFPAIVVGTPPFNLIASPQKSVFCASETIRFFSTATNANKYIWDFGDGISASVTDTFINHKYTSLGTKTVTVTPYFNGCPGNPTDFQVTVVGVIAKYGFANTCNDKKTYTFRNTSQGRQTGRLWDFGDSSATQSTFHVTHTFPTSGEFITSLTITDSISGCADTFSQTIYTADPVLVNTDFSICKNDSTSFSISNNYTNNSARYTWNILGRIIGPTNNPTQKIKATALGNYNNNFVSINYGSQNCRDTVQLNHQLLVKGPDLEFTAPSPLCLDKMVSINNSSKPFIATDSVLLWYWNFGNSVRNDTIYQPNSFQYQRPGTYPVKLTGIDVNGCKDSLSKDINVNPIPFLQVVPNIDTLCLGQSNLLKAFSNYNLLWSPATNISCATCDSVLVSPAVTTKYYVTSTTPLNCSIVDSVLVKVYSPFTTVAPVSTYYICPNEQVQLDINPKINKVTWTPAVGLSNPNIHNPIASPIQTSIYTATLTDSVGCFSSSATISVNLKSLPTVNAGPDKIVPYNSVFIISPTYSSNVSKYAWTPASLLYCNDCAIPSGAAPYSATYTVKVTSDSGCVATDSITVFVECKDANVLMPKAFTPNNDNLNDSYYPITRGIKTINKFVIYNRQGQLLYEANNFPPNSKSFAWRGDYKGRVQPAAAYIFLLEVLCEMGEKLTKTGSFMLLR